MMSQCSSPALVERPLSGRSYLVQCGPLLLLLAIAVSCGSSEAKIEPDAMVPSSPTTNLAVSTTTITSAEARSSFVSDAPTAAPILEGLSDSDLGCVADRLLIDLAPGEVITLTRDGPRPQQASLAVGALDHCDLVLPLVSIGLEQVISENPEVLAFDPACLLRGISAGELVPVLEARFASGSLSIADSKAVNLFATTPILANAMRCMSAATVNGSGDLSRVCNGWADSFGAIMVTLLAAGPEETYDLDPLDLLAVFTVVDEAFSWLANEVPAEIRGDAKLVREVTHRISEVMVEALGDTSASQPVEFEDLEGSKADPHMTAFLGAMTRLEAEFSADREEIDAAAGRLRNWTVGNCGSSSSMLFDFLAGAGVGL